MDDCAIIACFLNFYEMIAPLMVKIKPPVDLYSSGYEHQHASEKSLITSGYPI